MFKGKYTYYFLGLLIASALLLRLYSLFQTDNYADQKKVPELASRQESATTTKFLPEIIVTNPQPGQTVTSPLKVEGFAKRAWFAGGSLPISLLDDKGQTIATGRAQLVSGGESNALIPFSLNLEYSSETKRSYLLLRKSNPLNIEDEDASLRISLQLK